MPSVAEIIEHNLFEGARVLAGSAGLQRPVLWLHNAGVPDAPYWLNGGELAARLSKFQHERSASILVTSGIDDELVRTVIASIPRLTFMPKPFGLADLEAWFLRAMEIQSGGAHRPSLRSEQDGREIN